MNNYQEILKFGCGDHGCYFVKPTDMGTNGGCSCLSTITGTRSQVQSFKKLVELLSEQQEQIDKLEEEISEIMAGEDL